MEIFFSMITSESKIGTLRKINNFFYDSNEFYQTPYFRFENIYPYST